MNTAVKAIENVGVLLPVKYWGIFGLALMGLFLIGIDQGQTLSLLMGKVAYQQMFLHELFHDIRHAAGFACH
ncbi:MAG: CbtB-domain containing protein [Chloroflexi bacterium]|nr:CbtB-domain containing protein [Chloroflexota bacterium]